MKKKLKIGDILYRSKGVVEHAGAYFGNGKVIHNSPNGDVQLCSIDQYSDGKNIKVISSGLSTEQTQQFQQRAREKLNQDKGYNLIAFNCEQLVSQVLKGISKSSQVEGAAFGGITGALVAKSTSSKHTLWFALAGVLLGCAVTNAQRKYDYVI